LLGKKEKQPTSPIVPDAHAIFVLRADGLSGILDHLQVHGGRAIAIKRVHIGRLAVQMDGHQRLDAAAGGPVDQMPSRTAAVHR
jgi:hypothetical protein